MNIISILKQPMGGCEYYRQYMPNQLLGEKGHNITHTNSILPEHLIGQFDYLNEKIANADLYQFIRSDDLNMIPIAQAHGLKIVMDIDDYWKLDATSPYYEQYKRTGATEKIKFCLERADMVTTTTEYLADKIRKINSNVHVVPNAFTYREPQFKMVEKQHEKVTIGYVGGSTHLYDVNIMRESFRKLWNDSSLRGKFRVVFGGYIPQSPVHEEIRDILSGGFHKQSETDFYLVPGMEVRQFMQMYDHCDIMLAPLRDTEFNRCKSNLKIVEAASKGNMIICSDIEPYRGFGVPLVKTPKDWYRKMKEYILDEDARKEESNRINKLVVDNYVLEKVNDKRENLYCDLIQK